MAVQRRLGGQNIASGIDRIPEIRHLQLEQPALADIGEPDHGVPYREVRQEVQHMDGRGEERSRPRGVGTVERHVEMRPSTERP